MRALPERGVPPPRLPRRSRRARWTRASALGACAAVVLGLARLNACGPPLRVEPLRAGAGAPVVDARLDVARRYAPYVYAAFDPVGGRQDVPAPVDFDGDLRGDDNWDELPYYELRPTVYYSVLETETHLFLTYHLFHPRDWARFDLGLHLTHENDGENLQVVVDKAAERVVLLFTQAHYRGRAYAAADAGFGDGERRLCGPLLLVDEDGVPDRRGRHAGVFVEAGGHGIFGVLDAASDVAIAADGAATFRRTGWILRPRRPGEEAREPPLEAGLVVPYQLESTTAKLWPLLAAGELVGEGRLLDRTWPYADARVTVDVPRYYEGDRYSGPFGPDRGISPFAVDFGFERGELGALFFAPAERYAEVLCVPLPWSTRYVDHPF